MSETPMKKQALLIGINQYEILPELKYARQDAEAVEQSLKYNYCFSDDEVMLLTDSRAGLFKPSNRIRILNHLDNLANQDLDLFIFGFWGHGVVRSGKRYLCPLDVSPDEVEQLGVPFDVLMDKLSKIRAKNTCLILDCCQRVHDGERSEEDMFTAADQKAIENAARDIVLRRKENEPEFVSNVAILNSCKEGQAAYEWDNRKHGIFTAHLLDAMNRRYDSVAQIVGYVSSNVEKTARELNKKQSPLCRLEGDIPLPVDTKTTPLVTGEVFISYRHSNAALVAPIEEELKKRNISYFIDRVGINYGMEYSDAITQAIAESKLLLLLWTPEVKDSDDIINEVVLAQRMKKTVLPYKIGSFNELEHRRLCYHIARLSQYSVLVQTPETITELVDRVQQALTGKTYTFDLPKRSKDAVIEKPVVEDINVTFTPGQIERQQPIQYDKIQLPPLPEVLINIQAENKGREIAIAQLRDFTHESLAQANAAVAKAQAQFDAWSERKKRLWKDLSKEVQQSLQKTISSNPKCTEADIKVSTDNMSNQEYFDLLEGFQCGKKYEQARLELERVLNERKQKCDDVIKEFKQKIKSENETVEDIRTQFMDDVLLSILAVLPGYDNHETDFPDDLILEPLRLLDKYELGWRAPAEIARARFLWNRQRPCVIERKKQDLHALSIPGTIAGERRTVDIDNVDFTFRWCPAGSFMMGSPAYEDGRYDREKQHRVTLTQGFWMMEREVTQNQWKVIMDDNPSSFIGDDLPVEQVSWDDCQNFCKKCAKFNFPLQLPTEAQWEYACRAGSTTTYFWGRSLNGDKANCDGNDPCGTTNKGKCVGKTMPVGSYSPNDWGLYDMHGNVREWCQDWYGDYPSESVTNPVGPSSGSCRINRGGSWHDSARNCRSAYRSGRDSMYKGNHIGFRCVWSINNSEN